MMTPIPESKAMTEVREIREALSKELKKLSPCERASFIHSNAAALEKKYGLDLPHAGIDDEKTA